jgi:hypothetical protein
MPLNFLDNLEAAYNFNDTSWRDSTVNRFDLTGFGSPSASGGGVILDGVTQYLYHSDVSNLRGGDRDFGVYARFSLASVSGVNIIVSKDGEYALFSSGTTLYFSVRRFGGFEQVVVDVPTLFTPLTVGTIYHVIAWYDSVDKSLWIQNADDCVTSAASIGGASTNGTTVNPFQVGRGTEGGFAGTSVAHFNGTLYTVMFFSRTLDREDDCTTFYNGGNGYELLPQECTSSADFSSSNIKATDTDAKRMMLRVHRQAKTQENELELYYCRENSWHLMPKQPIFTKQNPVQITRSYRQPSTAQFILPDQEGLLVRQNKNSQYNYRSDGVTYDPILDAKRKILIRAGTKCFTNLLSGNTPTANVVPSGGALADLADGLLGNITLATTNYVSFSTSGLLVTIDFDLSAVKYVNHFIARFASKQDVCAFPVTCRFGWKRNLADDWSYSATRAVTGDGGDWDNDAGGNSTTIEIIKTDLEVFARYVRFEFTLTDSTHVVMIDEVATYGESAIGFYGGCKFVGYLGSNTSPSPAGLIAVTATSLHKKLIDNNSNMITAQYGNPPVETATIIRSLLQATAYWRGSPGSYNAPFSDEEIGWAADQAVTLFKWPIWQSQTNNMYGYVQELLHSIGWDMPDDNNGVLQLFEPPYRQYIPDRIFIAEDENLDGNNDCWDLTPVEDDVNQRNKVIVRSGDPAKSVTNTVKIQPDSIRRYGELLVKIEDPIAFDLSTREKIADYIIRDYAFRLGTLNATIRPDFDTHVKGVYGFRATRRMSLYPNDLDSVGDKRLQQLWTIESMVESISKGDWTAEVQCNPYVGLGPAAPTNVRATPEADPNNTFIDIRWDASTDTDVVIYKIYFSDDINNFPTTTGETDITTGPHAIGGFTPGTRYYFYVTALGANGIESVPSSIISAVAGGAAVDQSGWTVGDLAASFLQENPPADANGLWEYALYLTWTSPPIGATVEEQGYFGFKHGEFRFALDAIPSNPLQPSSWHAQDEWHGDRVPSLLTWDRVSVGDLYWYLKFRVNADLSGHTVYVRIFTWNTTNGEHGPAHASNIASVVIP